MPNIANMYQFHYLTSAQYTALATKNANALYFVSDTGKIYKGAEDYTNSVRVVAEFPATGIAQGVLYVNSTTGEAKTYNGAAWTTVVRPYDTEVTENSANGVTSGAVYTAIGAAKTELNAAKISKLDAAAQNQVILGGATDNTVVASGKTLGGATIATDAQTGAGDATKLATEAGVVTFVNDAIGDIDFTDYITNVTWTENTRTLNFFKDDDQTAAFSAQLTKVATDIDYDGSTGVITLKDVAGTTLKTINIPLDNFVKDGHYDAATQSLVLEMQNGSEVSIPVSALIDIYYGGTTNTASVTVSTVAGKETITVDVRVSAKAGNAIQTITTTGEEGLYVDLSGKADKVASATAGDIAALDANGNLTDSGKAAGGATITPDAQTGDGDANKLATEAGVVSYVGDILDDYIPTANIVTDLATASAATDDNVASVPAIIEALSWHTYA